MVWHYEVRGETWSPALSGGGIGGSHFHSLILVVVVTEVAAFLVVVPEWQSRRLHEDLLPKRYSETLASSSKTARHILGHAHFVLVVFSTCILLAVPSQTIPLCYGPRTSGRSSPLMHTYMSPAGRSLRRHTLFNPVFGLLVTCWSFLRQAQKAPHGARWKN